MKNTSKPYCYLTAICLAAIVALGASVSASGQPLQPTKSVHIPIFGENIVVNTYEKRLQKKSPITFVVLHHNEDVGLELVKQEIQQSRIDVGRLVEVVSLRGGSKQRNIFFTSDQTVLCFDPNRIFSEIGINATLMDEKIKLPATCMNNRSDQGRALAASREVKTAVIEFQRKLLDEIIPKKACRPNERQIQQLCRGELLIAVHNNTDFDKVGNTAINAKWFLRGENEGSITEASYIVNKEDLDNFFIVSDNNLFTKLLNYSNKAKQFSVAIQEKMPNPDDGSFSVYCGLRSIPYINIEADIDRGKARQLEMIKRVIELFPAK
jgi:hypothetical protein